MLGQRTFRKRPFLKGVSPTSDDISESQSSTGRTSIGRQSVVSRRSGAVSVKSAGAKSAASDLAEGLQHHSKWLYAREYLLILIEAFMSMAHFVIRERYSTFVSLVVGCLADSYIKHYTIALFTVVLHFAMCSLVFMEETIIGNKKGNPYGAFMRNICKVALVLIKSTDFMRLVYGLQGMVNRKKSALFLFIFLQFWVSSSPTHGGIIVNVFYATLRYTNFRRSVVAFVGAGLSLYAFVYVLYPEAQEKETTGLGCKVVRCLLLASYYKIFRVRTRGKRGFLNKTEGKCDKSTISRTFELLMLYALLLPTLGVHFFTTTTTDLTFGTIFLKTKTNEFVDTVGLQQLSGIISGVAMLLSYFGLWPLLTLIGVNKRDTMKFLLGHLIMLVCFFYSSVVVRIMEDPKYSYSSGFVRIYNTREKSIKMIPQDEFSMYSFEVDPRSSKMASYPTESMWLFPMKIIFNGSKTNFTTFLSVTHDEATGYMAIDPPEMVRIKGYLPLREGPPGSNRHSWPRIYIFNAAQTLYGEILRIKRDKHKATLKQIEMRGGVMESVALEPGTYDFSIAEADVYADDVRFEQGGVYGVMIFATSSSREITVDMVVPPNTVTVWAVIIFSILSGLTYGITQPTLLGIIFNISPRGLTAMSLSFVPAMKGVSYFISYIGFRTWHYFVTANVLFAYSFGVTLFFFLCLFFLFKFKQSYS